MNLLGQTTDYPGIDGFLGFRGSLMLDVVFLAMFAVGLWGAQMGGRSVWTLPVIFPMIMTFGGIAGMLRPRQTLTATWWWYPPAARKDAVGSAIRSSKPRTSR